MRQRLTDLLAFSGLLLLLGACTGDDPRTELVIQRFFGACETQYGAVTDPAAAEGECGIITTIINRFEQQNPDIRVVENVVAWPGYDQLTAQLAANDAPDLVTMHGSVIADYQVRGLLAPMGEALASVGIDPDTLTRAARQAVTIDGELWGLPIDTWAPLWHVNMNLFREAGLVRDGRPVLPDSPETLLRQAAQFVERTGKPYLVQATANEYASFARNFYTFVMQQGGTLFPSARRADFTTPEAERALMLFRTIDERGLTTRNLDYSAAVAAFLRGEGGVFLVGTWMVGAFHAESQRQPSPLYEGYEVMPYPQLFDRDATYVDGHNWVMPADPGRTAVEREAALRFLEFFSKHDFQWSRTGHLPVFTHTVESERWRSLPYRANLAALTRTGTPLPGNVRRQFPILTIVGQEAGAAINGIKPIPRALSDMERRVNDVLEHM